MGLRLLGVQLASGLIFRDIFKWGLGLAAPTGHRCASGAYDFGGIGAYSFGTIGAYGLGGMWEVYVFACYTLYMTPHVTNIARFKS